MVVFKFRRIGFLAILALFLQSSFAQISFPKAAVSDVRSQTYAFENARIFVDYQTELPNATLLIRNGKVVACANTVRTPTDAVRVDCAGKTIYPAFIDIYAAGFGLPEPKAVGERQKAQPQEYSNQKGPYSWNEALKPEYQAVESYVYDEKAAKEYLDIGFATLLSHQADGISRGTGVLVAPIAERPHECILETQAGHFLSFRKGKSTQNYPNSLMGTIALIRQTYLDGKWYAREGHKSEVNLSLEAWNTVQQLPQFFETEDVLDALRIGQIAKEFSQKYIIKSNGDDYQKIEALRAQNIPLILPLNFPEDLKVDDPFEALSVSLAQLKHWEMAASNPAAVATAGLPFALTSHGLKKKNQFFHQIEKAIEAGLEEQMALRALTTTPAEMLGMRDKLGSLEAGKYANFIITTGPVFEKNTKILETWSLGKMHKVEANLNEISMLSEGLYNFILEGDMMMQMKVSKEAEKMKCTILKGEENIQTKSTFEAPFVVLSFALKEGAYYQLSGTVEGNEIAGSGTNPFGEWLTWKAVKKEGLEDKIIEKPEEIKKNELFEAKNLFPFGSYGWAEAPKMETVLVKNTTVWTGEKEGILEDTDVLFSKGKIQKIGKAILAPDNAIIIDGKDKYLTAGIIDEHSHIAVTRGVNEGTQESSAEVRIGDVINSEDINIYRQLAGGVTSSHILHGSANPIGGQTQLLKLRWGKTPQEMKFENWDGFIKFALGENVKQSNWGDANTSRFPQTRMGVEQVFVDYFTRAQEYAAEKQSGQTYRRDLELDCLSEILQKKRFITCHSYVQSEINMLMKVAEQFDFRLSTFTHILEGYKVADKMAAHGAGGSTFSDWWAYKFEVYQAIPYNAALMQEQGVTVAINSDDREMARRLNQEAAKAVKYGGMSEEEAWKLVTLNPAKLLHIDDRVGSIKAGKDADLVLWTANPLSVYAQVEHTWVDGAPYFDRKSDLEKRKEIQAERNRIIAKMLRQGKGKSTSQEDKGDEAPEYHCDSVHDEG